MTDGWNKRIERNGLVNRAKLGSGPWDDEPDQIDWTWNGFRCRIKRHETFGGLCGYIIVPPGHPWHGKGIDDPALGNVEVHGGITWSGPQEDGGEWLVGFDCAHAFDAIPLFDARFRTAGLHDVYRDIEYVRFNVGLLVTAAKVRRGGRFAMLVLTAFIATAIGGQLAYFHWVWDAPVWARVLIGGAAGIVSGRLAAKVVWWRIRRRAG